MLIDTPTERDLLANLGTCRCGEKNLGEVTLDAHNTATCRSGADVHHEHFILRQLLDL